MFVYKSSLQVSVIEVVPLEGGGFLERKAHARLPSRKVTILDIHGSLFYAGAWTMERRLPRVEGLAGAVVVFRLHGHNEIGSTFIDVVERYSRDLYEHGGKLMIAGAGRRVMAQLRQTGVVDDLGPENVIEEGEVLEDAIYQAYEAGSRWIETSHSEK
jgi:SulP family sulfate permease